MILDSSAVLAIIFEEPEANRFLHAIALAPWRRISSVNWLECMMVLAARRRPEALSTAVALMAGMRVEQVAFEAEQARAALEAFERFGKGRHPAALNFGDCCAYATAVLSGEPLLFKGGDFARTDVLRSVW